MSKWTRAAMFLTFIFLAGVATKMTAFLYGQKLATDSAIFYFSARASYYFCKEHF